MCVCVHPLIGSKVMVVFLKSRRRTGTHDEVSAASVGRLFVPVIVGTAAF